MQIHYNFGQSFHVNRFGKVVANVFDSKLERFKMSFKSISPAEKLEIASRLSFLTHIYYSDLVGIAPDIFE